jgi:hypothetical protein
MNVQIEFLLSLEELNDLRTAIIHSDLPPSATDWYVAKLNEVERKEIIRSSKFIINRLSQEISSSATSKDNIDVVSAIEDNIYRLKSVLK